MNPSIAEQTPRKIRPVFSQRLAISISVGWSALLLLAAWFLSKWLGIIHDFESGGEFDAHNRIHWFRPIAFFWFERYSVFPSLILALLIWARHVVVLGPRFVTFVLAMLTVSLLAIGAYTIQEQLAVMHQFVL